MPVGATRIVQPLGPGIHAPIQAMLLHSTASTAVYLAGLINIEPMHWIGGCLKIVLSREVLSDSSHTHLESPLTVLSTDVGDSEHWWLARGLAKDGQWAIWQLGS